MRKLATLVISAIAVAFSGIAIADTLELADGQVLEGDFIGSSNGIIMFDTGEGIEAFPESEVVGVFFSSGVHTAETLLADSGPDSLSADLGKRLASLVRERADIMMATIDLRRQLIEVLDCDRWDKVFR